VGLDSCKSADNLEGWGRSLLCGCVSSGDTGSDLSSILSSCIRLARYSLSASVDDLSESVLFLVGEKSYLANAPSGPGISESLRNEDESSAVCSRTPEDEY